MTSVRDQWAARSSYEDLMGRWSRSLARELISWMQIPRGAHWLDIGCGTVALSDTNCSLADPASVVGCDPSVPVIEFAREHSRDIRQSFVITGVGSLLEWSTKLWSYSQSATTNTAITLFRRFRRYPQLCQSGNLGANRARAWLPPGASSPYGEGGR